MSAPPDSLEARIVDALGLPSQDAERLVLSCMLQRPECIGEVSSIISPADMTEAVHRNLYALILRMLRQGAPIDTVTVGMESAAMPGHECGTVPYLMTVADAAPSPAAAKYYANRVRGARMVRELRDAVSDMSEALESHKGLSGAIAGMEACMEAVRSGNGTDVHDLMTAVDAELTRMDDVRSGRAKDVVWSTGLRDLDVILLGGMRPTKSIVVGGRPSMGKSALGMQLANSVLLQGGVVHVWSGEMHRSEIAQRLLAGWAEVNLARVSRPDDLDQQDWDDLAGSFATMQKYGLKGGISDTPGLTFDAIVAGAKQTMARHGGLDLLVIDYLQLLEGQRGDAPYVTLTEASKRAKVTAKKLDCAVVLVCQLNRKVEERKDKRPVLSDIRETGQIEQDADVVLFPFRPGHYEPEKHSPGASEIAVAKQRGGKLGIATGIEWQGKYTRFVDKEEMFRADEF